MTSEHTSRFLPCFILIIQRDRTLPHTGLCFFRKNADIGLFSSPLPLVEMDPSRGRMIQVREVMRVERRFSFLLISGLALGVFVGGECGSTLVPTVLNPAGQGQNLPSEDDFDSFAEDAETGRRMFTLSCPGELPATLSPRGGLATRRLVVRVDPEFSDMLKLRWEFTSNGGSLTILDSYDHSFLADVSPQHGPVTIESTYSLALRAADDLNTPQKEGLGSVTLRVCESLCGSGCAGCPASESAWCTINIVDE